MYCTLMLSRNNVQKRSWRKADRIMASIHVGPEIFSPIQLCLCDCQHHCADIQNHLRSPLWRTAYKQTEESYRPPRHREHILLCSSLALNGHTAGTSAHTSPILHSKWWLSAASSIGELLHELHGGQKGQRNHFPYREWQRVTWK